MKRLFCKLWFCRSTPGDTIHKDCWCRREVSLCLFVRNKQKSSNLSVSSMCSYHLLLWEMYSMNLFFNIINSEQKSIVPPTVHLIDTGSVLAAEPESLSCCWSLKDPRSCREDASVQVRFHRTGYVMFQEEVMNIITCSVTAVTLRDRINDS